MDTYSTSEMFEKHRECLKSIITNKNGTKMSRNEEWKKKYLNAQCRYKCGAAADVEMVQLKWIG